MNRNKRHLLLLAVAAALTVAGCAGRVTVAEPPATIQVMVATQDELLQKLAQNMENFVGVTAKAEMSVANQTILVPATLSDDLRRLRGKDYEKKFGEATVNGLLVISRPDHETRKIRFTGDVISASVNFMLLAVNDKFWVTLPNMDKETQSDTRGKVFTGNDDRMFLRPQEFFTIRPQDVSDLLLYDEVFPAVNRTHMIYYVEEWPEYYILNFLHYQWPHHIYSKVWFDRTNLNVLIHQLYDGAGRVIAEGRFNPQTYKDFASEDGTLKVSLPTEIELLWPIDMLVMRARLSNVKVNPMEPGIPSRIFEPAFSGYEEVQVPKGELPLP